MRSLFLLVSLVAVAGSAFGATVFVDPVFYGEDNSTMAIWSFDKEENLEPEIWENDFGTPSVAIVPDGFLDTFYIETDSVTGRQGIWKTEGHFEFAIDNSDLTGPGTYKDIVVQVIFDSAPSSAQAGDRIWLDYSADGSLPAGGIEPDSVAVLSDGEFSLATWEIRLPTNPTEEVIYLLPYYCNLYVDAVRIDTVCVPEPATIGMLGLGGVFGLLRRRKR